MSKLIVTSTESNMISEQSNATAFKYANRSVYVGENLSLNDWLEDFCCYKTWKFAKQMSLLMDDLWNCGIGDDEDNSKDQRSLVKICLIVPACCLFTC